MSENKRKAREEKKTLVKRKKRLRTAGIVFLGILLVYSLQKVMQTDYFMIKDIKINGGARILDDEIIEMANIPPKTSIFALKTLETKKNLESSPWIRSSEISKRLPGTVILDIKEEQAVAKLALKNELWLISRQCVALEKIIDESAVGNNLPVIKYDGQAVVELGYKIKNKQILATVKVINSMDTDMKNSIDYFAFLNKDVYAMLKNKDVQIIYGNDNRITKKNYIVQKILADSEKKKDNLYYIDVRVPSSPTIKKVPSAKEIQN